MAVKKNVVAISPQARLAVNELPDLVQGRPPRRADSAWRDFSPHCGQFAGVDSLQVDIDGHSSIIGKIVFYKAFSRSGEIVLSPRSPLALILVMSAHPEGSSTVLVTTHGHDIEIVIVDVEQLVTAQIAGINVKDIAVLVPVEHAVALPIGGAGILDPIGRLRLPPRK
jgi:hypothetical protein